MKTKRINITKENMPKIKEELNWHMKSFTLTCEQEQIMGCDPNSVVHNVNTKERYNRFGVYIDGFSKIQKKERIVT